MSATSEEFDAIVVGSGFGGAVSACRLAEADLSVAVLERGKPYPPGSFPRSPREMSVNFWDPSEGLHGMFDIWSFRGLEAVVASGLGGGSLIYGNVLIRKPERWFVQDTDGRAGSESWPLARADLDPYYARAESVLGANPYPFDRKPYSESRKTQALQSAGDRIGVEWSLPNLAVSFGTPEPVPGTPVGDADANLHHAQRFACRLCGECDIGCNFGSKNTTDFNYLSVAQQHGALIETGCEVRRIEQRDDRFRVHFVRHDWDRGGEPADTGTLPEETWCSKVLVPAG